MDTPLRAEPDASAITLKLGARPARAANLMPQTPTSTQEPSRQLTTTITPCLWFDRQAEEAARFYCALFPDSRIEDVQTAAADYPDGRKGDVLTVEFTLMGRPFTGLNGGPLFRFNEAVSFQVPCKDQAEMDRYTKALSAHPENEQCGWVKDKYGVSWQIVPVRLWELLADPDRAKAQRVMEAMLEMKRLDLAALERAGRGA